MLWELKIKCSPWVEDVLFVMQMFQCLKKSTWWLKGKFQCHAADQAELDTRDPTVWWG